MMHSDRLVCAIKVNGQILRETGNTVKLPFGSEYSIYIKNLNSVRAQVQISIDGEDAADRLIIAPNSSIEIERFIKNGNLQSGNRFRFIERSGAVEKHRGVGAEDGLIRVEGWRELVQPFVPQPIPVPHYYDYPVPIPRLYPVWPRPHWPYHEPWITWSSNSTLGTTGHNLNNVQAANFTASNASTGAQKTAHNLQRSVRAKSASPLRGNGLNIQEQALGDAGITVPGSISNQQFVSAPDFKLESQSTVVVLRLSGYTGKLRVAAPVTVKSKPTCLTCGKKNRSGDQFCSRCSAALALA